MGPACLKGGKARKKEDLRDAKKRKERAFPTPARSEGETKGKKRPSDEPSELDAT